MHDIPGLPDIQRLQVFTKLRQVHGVIHYGMIGSPTAELQLFKVGVNTGSDGIVHARIVAFCVGFNIIF